MCTSGFACMYIYVPNVCRWKQEDITSLGAEDSDGYESHVGTELGVSGRTVGAFNC